MIYFDNSATTRQYTQVSDLMYKVMREEFGNPSSLHSKGLEAEKLVTKARKQVAAAVGTSAENIYFTSGGTESDNTAISGVAWAKKREGKKIITTEIEHPAILEECSFLEKQGYEIVCVKPGKDGIVSAESVLERLDGDTILVSVMAVNNETGAIMPLEAISQGICRYNKDNGRNIVFHSDMVQSFGKVKFSSETVDIASFSGHKIHGPKGIGALYVKKGVRIEPFIHGGGQERHFRSGTENVPAIVGFGLAAELTDKNFDKNTANMAAVRERLLNGIKQEIKDIKVNTPMEIPAPSVLNISFMGTRGEVILHTLEQKQVYVSTGSACASNHKNKGGSHVLRAMGLNAKDVEGAIRFSFGAENTPEEADETVKIIKEAVESFRRLGSFRSRSIGVMDAPEIL